MFTWPENEAGRGFEEVLKIKMHLLKLLNKIASFKVFGFKLKLAERAHFVGLLTGSNFAHSDCFHPAFKEVVLYFFKNGSNGKARRVLLEKTTRRGR
uniref:Uncharacterized protein n=1 Tax=Romanomermis culicivorax TaxID=13658 RepID=A0A915KYN0_ROMCU